MIYSTTVRVGSRTVNIVYKDTDKPKYDFHSQSGSLILDIKTPKSDQKHVLYQSQKEIFC